MSIVLLLNNIYDKYHVNNTKEVAFHYITKGFHRLMNSVVNKSLIIELNIKNRNGSIAFTQACFWFVLFR